MSNSENPVVQNYEFANAYDSLPIHGVVLHKDFKVEIQPEELEAERKRFPWHDEYFRYSIVL